MADVVTVQRNDTSNLLTVLGTPGDRLFSISKVLRGQCHDGILTAECRCELPSPSKGSTTESQREDQWLLPGPQYDGTQSHSVLTDSNDALPQLPIWTLTDSISTRPSDRHNLGSP